MRTRWTVSGILVIVSAIPAGAQQFPAEKEILLAQVQVFSGPSEKSCQTSLLRKGDKVTVLREVNDRPGWLAIKPPANSFSWIEVGAIEFVDRRFAYVPFDLVAKVLPGSSLTDQEPNVDGVSVRGGTIVVALGRPFRRGPSVWLPIEPPAALTASSLS
jgi:hypothetical protein